MLVSRGTDAALEFADEMDAALTALYTWDLRWAANLAIAECTDEMFLRLRAWLVGQGYNTWAVARYDAEATFSKLLHEAGSRAGLGERLARGGALLEVASRAHETLTGETLEHPSPETVLPPGEPIDPADAPIQFPDLYRAANTAWIEESQAILRRIELAEKVTDGFGAVGTGNHARGEAILRPLFDDPESWEIISADSDLRTGVAYALGVGDLIAGNVDRAAETFLRVESDFPDVPELRRGMAQVELARGNLDAAAALLDPSPDATRFDRVLTAKLAWRQGEHEEAVRRARAELDRHVARDDHPWDVAGALLQAGHILVDAGMAPEARQAAKRMKPLLRSADSGFELKIEWRLLEASVARLEGKPGKALDMVTKIRDASGYTLATWHRERARALRDLGRTEEAAVAYQEAIAVLEDAGERWEARALAEELAALGA